MSDDDKKGGGESAVPFVQNDDSSLWVAAAHAQRQRWHRNASLYMNNQSPLPLAVLSGNVLYVDFGFTRRGNTGRKSPSRPAIDLSTTKAGAMLSLHFSCSGRCTIGYGTSSIPERTRAKVRATTLFGSSFSPAVRSLHGCAMLPMPVSIPA